MKTRYIPAGARAIGTPNAVAYKYEGKNGSPYAIGYWGKRTKHAFHYRFKDEAQRNKHIADFLRNADTAAEEKAKRQKERVGYVHTLEVGDILDYSWGYDQTNRNFYQVTARTDHTVTVREIAVERSAEIGFMTANVVPIPNAFLEDSKPQRKRVQKSSFNGGYDFVRMDYGVADKWDGTPKYISWYA